MSTEALLLWRRQWQGALLGLDTIRLFEIGTVFIGKENNQHEEMRVATVDKGTFEELPLKDFIEKYKIDVSNPMTLKEMNSGTFKMWSLYPFITRDIAVWVEGNENLSVLEEIVTTFANMYCVREPVLFDHFEKEGRTSVAYRLVFQSYEKTLTEVEVEKWFVELTEKIKNNKSFEVR
jgi:phenylalanyl-tRNA synthetase beta subunit